MLLAAKKPGSSQESVASFLSMLSCLIGHGQQSLSVAGDAARKVVRLLGSLTHIDGRPCGVQDYFFDAIFLAEKGGRVSSALQKESNALLPAPSWHKQPAEDAAGW